MNPAAPWNITKTTKSVLLGVVPKTAGRIYSSLAQNKETVCPSLYCKLNCGVSERYRIPSHVSVRRLLVQNPEALPHRPEALPQDQEEQELSVASEMNMSSS